jgi:hypothetical protein
MELTGIHTAILETEHSRRKKITENRTLQINMREKEHSKISKEREEHSKTI